MHTLVRRYIKTAVLFLAAGLVVGGYMVAVRELAGRYPSTYLISAHTHAILVGFVMMMILGVALWLFPRPSSDDERYRPQVAEVAYWLLTLGTAGRLAGELMRAGGMGAEWLRWAVVATSWAQIAAIGLFFYTMWSRIRPGGSRIREERGERF